MGGQLVLNGVFFQFFIYAFGVMAAVIGFFAVRTLQRIESDIKDVAMDLKGQIQEVSGDLKAHVREEGPKLSKMADRLVRIEAQNAQQTADFRQSQAPKR